MESKEFKVTISKREMKGDTHFRNVCILMNSLSDEGKYTSDDESYTWNFDGTIPTNTEIIERALRRLSVFDPAFLPR